MKKHKREKVRDSWWGITIQNRLRAENKRKEKEKGKVCSNIHRGRTKIPKKN